MEARGTTLCAGGSCGHLTPQFCCERLQCSCDHMQFLEAGARLQQLPLGRDSGRALQRADKAQRTHTVFSDKETDSYQQTNSENG